MKTRRLLKNFILMMLMVAIIAPIAQPLTVQAKRKSYGVGHPADLEHPYNWIDYSDDEVEAQILAEQKEAGSKDDFIVNYYTVREMVLNNEYDHEILSKKYQMMDEFFRYYAQFSDSRPFYDTESRPIVYKIGIIDKIWELDSGSVVFTLTDNPTKRFLIMPGYDYFHFRYLTQPGDKVSLLTTTDRVVYEFDNYDLTRGQDVNYTGYMNYRHPEDMIIDGYFPSSLYKERLEESDIEPESWLQLMLEYVDVEYEEYNGYANYTNVNISPDRIYSIEEYYEMQRLFDAFKKEIRGDMNGMANWSARRDANGFDYDVVDELLICTYGEIREIKTIGNGKVAFTLWAEPTRWYYISGYYDPLHLAEITKPGDDVYVIHTLGKIVYGFNNGTIFGNTLPINNPDFLDKPAYTEDHNHDSKENYFKMYSKMSVTEFWTRVGELPEEDQQKYEELNMPKEIED